MSSLDRQEQVPSMSLSSCDDSLELMVVDGLLEASCSPHLMVEDGSMMMISSNKDVVMMSSDFLGQISTRKYVC